MASNPLVNGRGHQFINIKNNPPLSSECGSKIALILDHSGSISGSLQSYRDAANGVIDTLANTPTQVQIYSFGSTANANTGLLDLSQPGDVTAAHTAITSVYANLFGGSNFDAAFQAIPGGFDTAFVLTDGNATEWNGTVNNSGPTLNVIEATIASANTVRTSAHVVAVAAGPGNTPTTLQVMSGPGDYVTNGLVGTPADPRLHQERLQRPDHREEDDGPGWERGFVPVHHELQRRVLALGRAVEGLGADGAGHVLGRGDHAGARGSSTDVDVFGRVAGRCDQGRSG